ncbi:MAG: antitoxin [Candidatus Dadabacteria bacterium]|nr:antitoxin [Candidatus Dadabacteria bacterium]
MKTKLTLRIEEMLIRKAKIVSKKEGKSLSKIVSDYFLVLDGKINEKVDIPPVTRSIIGILKDKPVDEVDYKKYLETKHL